jgi:hypothetical protein
VSAQPPSWAAERSTNQLASLDSGGYFVDMSLTEIIEELPRLDDNERLTILRRLVALDAGREIDETPDMLAGIDAGIASMETDPGVTLEEARQRLAGWITE